MGIGQQNEKAYESVPEQAVASETELESIAASLASLNDYAADINRVIANFNDRVQGGTPRDPSGCETKSGDDSLLGGIRETIGYLNSIMGQLDNETRKLNNIG